MDWPTRIRGSPSWRRATTGALDSRAALQVAREDSLVDQEYDAIMRQLITYMMEGPRSITRVLDTAWAVRALDGKDIRHLSYEDLDEEPADGGSG